MRFDRRRTTDDRRGTDRAAHVSKRFLRRTTTARDIARATAYLRARLCLSVEVSV
jgi:hypothetical protein